MKKLLGTIILLVIFLSQNYAVDTNRKVSIDRIYEESSKIKNQTTSKELLDSIGHNSQNIRKSYLFPSDISPVQDGGGADEEVPEFRSSGLYIPRYEAGQGSVSLGAGVIFPLFFQTLTGDIASTSLSLGGDIWFEWDIYLWKALSTGMEIAGAFMLTKNSRTLFLAPITAHIKYTFQMYPVEIPVSFAAGVSLASLENLFKADFIMKPKVGLAYRINQNWALGLFSSYWFILQYYGEDSGVSPDDSRLGNFIDTTLGFTYVF